MAVLNYKQYVNFDVVLHLYLYIYHVNRNTKSLIIVELISYYPSNV